MRLALNKVHVGWGWGKGEKLENHTERFMSSTEVE